MCVIMSFIVRDFYIKRSFSLTGKMHIGSIIPVLSAVVFLVIVVVKSSLALSLGLVGALSIVRFRAAIKEPEELVYLFLSIATGLGLGAGQRPATLVAFTMIIIFMTLIKNKKRVEDGKNIHIYLSWLANPDIESNNFNEDVTKILLKHAKTVNLRKFESQNHNYELNFILDIKNTKLSPLVKDLKDEFNEINITVLDQNNVPKL